MGNISNIQKFLFLVIVLLGLIGCSQKADDNAKYDPHDLAKYEKIRHEYELVGGWTIENSILKQKYDYEIYSKGKDIKGVQVFDSAFRFETLQKINNKYSVVGSEYGEYYLVNDKMEMLLFDEDGELSNSGYRAKTK